MEKRRPKSHAAHRWAVLLAVVALVPAGTAAAFGWAHHPESAVVAEPMRRPPRFDRTFDVSSFLKGNLHAHSSRSDGDSPPEEVIAWYRHHGYAFLALTDHNRFTDARTFASLQDDRFRLLNGEEVTMKGGGRQVHVNALCTTTRLGGGTFASAGEALAWATTRIALQGGISIVNHPNFDHALRPVDLLAAEAAPLLEVMSGHPYVYSQGTADRPSHEAMWDFALTAGARFMGAAVDDVHHLRVDADPPAYAGRGWVQVFGERNDPAAICDALRRGLLYSSSGASLRRIQVTETTYTVWPADRGATVRFLGRDGRVLHESGPLTEGAPAEYALHSDDRYVRAKVIARDGTAAWTPAVFESLQSTSAGMAAVARH